jgi:hypothetical protein
MEEHVSGGLPSVRRLIAIDYKYTRILRLPKRTP